MPWVGLDEVLERFQSGWCEWDSVTFDGRRGCVRDVLPYSWGSMAIVQIVARDIVKRLVVQVVWCESWYPYWIAVAFSVPVTLGNQSAVLRALLASIESEFQVVLDRLKRIQSGQFQWVSVRFDGYWGCVRDSMPYFCGSIGIAQVVGWGRVKGRGVWCGSRYPYWFVATFSSVLFVGFVFLVFRGAVLKEIVEGGWDKRSLDVWLATGPFV
jgi:hypothetical protein